MVNVRDDAEITDAGLVHIAIVAMGNGKWEMGGRSERLEVGGGRYQL